MIINTKAKDHNSVPPLCVFFCLKMLKHHSNCFIVFTVGSIASNSGRTSAGEAVLNVQYRVPNNSRVSGKGPCGELPDATDSMVPMMIKSVSLT